MMYVVCYAYHGDAREYRCEPRWMRAEAEEQMSRNIGRYGSLARYWIREVPPVGAFAAK